MTPVSNVLIIGFRSCFFPILSLRCLSWNIFLISISQPAVVPAIECDCNYPVVGKVPFFESEIVRRVRAKGISK